MNIDLPSITAFALEGSGPAALAVGADHTLTLQLQGRGEWVGRSLGTARQAVPREAKPGTLRAAVVPCSSSGLTLTF
jgi:hypothetical protein